MSSPAKAALSVVLISLLGFPATYFVNTAQTLQGERGLLVAGVLSLTIICLLTYLALSSFKQPKDWLFYVFTLSTFSSVVDIIIGLETDGYVSGFMSNYLKDGEPYLGTPYGAAICYWDGTVHYALYLIMLTAMAFQWNYRVFGLYWVGTIGHSMLVLIPGAILSKFGVRWSFCLNVPYIIIPIVSAIRFLGERKQESAAVQNKSSASRLKLYQRPLDTLFIIAFIASTLVALLRAFAVLGCSSSITTQYINEFEPYLKDPVAFPKAQMLVYMYYFIPFYVFAICALVSPGHTVIPDWAVIFAGAAAQAQVSHIVSCLHHRTPLEYQVPDNARTTFWMINILLLVVPHLFAVRCWCFPTFFSSSPDVIGTAAKMDSKRRVKKYE